MLRLSLLPSPFASPSSSRYGEYMLICKAALTRAASCVDNGSGCLHPTVTDRSSMRGHREGTHAVEVQRKRCTRIEGRMPRPDDHQSISQGQELRKGGKGSDVAAHPAPFKAVTSSVGDLSPATGCRLRLQTGLAYGRKPSDQGVGEDWRILSITKVEPIQGFRGEVNTRTCGGPP